MLGMQIRTIPIIIGALTNAKYREMKRYFDATAKGEDAHVDIDAITDVSPSRRRGANNRATKRRKKGNVIMQNRYN